MRQWVRIFMVNLCLINIKFEEFTKLYAEAVENGVVFNIAEKPKDYGPLLIDLDLELPLEKHNNKRLYTDDMIYELINTYRTLESIGSFFGFFEFFLKNSLCQKSSFSHQFSSFFFIPL